MVIKFTTTDCEKWLTNKKVNPVTNKKLNIYTKNGIYKKLNHLCLGASPLPTKRKTSKKTSRKKNLQLFISPSNCAEMKAWINYNCSSPKSNSLKFSPKYTSTPKTTPKKKTSKKHLTPKKKTPKRPSAPKKLTPKRPSTPKKKSKEAKMKLGQFTLNKLLLPMPQINNKAEKQIAIDAIRYGRNNREAFENKAKNTIYRSRLGQNKNIFQELERKRQLAVLLAEEAKI
jgi:hypothetical protein